MSDNSTMEEYNNVKNRCPHCNHVNKDNLEKQSKTLEYKIHDKIISYDSKYIICEKCGRKVFLSNLYPLCNDFIKLLISAHLGDNVLAEQYIKKINILLEEKKMKTQGNEAIRLPHFESFKNSLSWIRRILSELCMASSSLTGQEQVKIPWSFFDYPNDVKENNLKEGNKLFENKSKKNYYCIFSCFDFLEFVTAYNKPNKIYWFRGQKAKYSLVPGIFRQQDDKFYEVRMMQYFMQRAAAFTSKCPNEEDWIKWLPFMQHYELHTRLLDWTDSPLCALFFALDKGKCNQKDEDAAIFMFEPEIWNKMFHEIQDEELVVHKIPILDITPNLKVNLVAKSAFKEFHMPFELYPIAVSTIRRHDRMYNQQANFTLHDSAIDMYKLCPEAFIKIIIPKRYKKKMREELMNMGIDKTTFFPELTALAEVTNQRIK